MTTLAFETPLIRRYKLGDREAFQELYERTVPVIFNALQRLLQDAEDARDIAQDAYVTAYEKRHEFREEANFQTWLYRIAMNKALNFLKRRKRVHSLDDDQEVAQRSSEPNGLIRDLLDSLSPEYRSCIILRDIQKFSYEEIADILKISIGTVRSRLNRGRAQLVEAYRQ